MIFTKQSLPKNKKFSQEQSNLSSVNFAVNNFVQLERSPDAVNGTEFFSNIYDIKQHAIGSHEGLEINDGQFKPLDRAQFNFHAANMEKARCHLLDLLLSHPVAIKYLAEEYLQRIDLGIDQSEMFSLNYSKQYSDAVQDDNFVQVNAKDFGLQINALCRQIISTPTLNAIKQQNVNYKQLRELHFLPIFLQRVAECFIQDDAISQLDKANVKEQLTILVNSRQIIINSNVRIVAFIVNKYAHSKIAFSDLMQEGAIGLIKAVDRFDYLRSVKFSTYAVYWIRKMISRAITKQKKLVSLPFNLANKISTVFAVINQSLSKNNKWPSSSVLATSCEMTIKEVESVLEFCRPCISITSNANNDDELPCILDTLEQYHFASPLNDLTSKTLESSLSQAISSLSDREAYVIRTRFGLNTGIELTLQDIADQIDVSKERVRQIQNSALSKLREKYGPELGDFLTADVA